MILHYVQQSIAGPGCRLSSQYRLMPFVASIRLYWRTLAWQRIFVLIAPHDCRKQPRGTVCEQIALYKKS